MKMIKNYAVALSVVAAMACTATVFALPQTAVAGRQMVGHMQKGIGVFDSLLKAGTIDQKTYDAIKVYLEANKPEHKDMFSEMLEKGIINKTQYDAISASKPEKKMEQNRERKSPFSKLVESGTISQATSDKIENYLKTNKPSAPSEAGKKDMLSNLLENNIITQAEYDAIVALKKTQPEGRPEGASPFAKLVENGTIDKETQSKMEEYLQANKPVKAADAQKGGERKDIFADLLSKNIITQAQYDAILKSMPTPSFKNK